jgi:hypothetical protein
VNDVTTKEIATDNEILRGIVGSTSRHHWAVPDGGRGRGQGQAMLVRHEAKIGHELAWIVEPARMSPISANTPAAITSATPRSA